MNKYKVYTNCSKCGELVHKLERYPKNVCKKCYKETFDKLTVAEQTIILLNNFKTI